MQKVRKAVIPAAGFGTRMLPITKTVSKEILPVVDKPIIQVIVEDLVDGGIRDIIIVTSQRKADLVDYFSDVDSGVLEHLKAKNKQALVRQLEDIHSLANIAFIEQRSVYGTGGPVLDAEPYLGDEPFVYMFADNFFMAEQGATQQMLEAYNTYDASIDGCLVREADEDYERYGYVGGAELEPGVLRLDRPVIEFPGKQNAPSNLAQAGMFIIKPEVLPYLHRALDQLPPTGRELYFHSSFNLMLEEGLTSVVAKKIEHERFCDTGNKLEYMKSCVAMAAAHPEIGADFRRFLQDFMAKD